MTYGRREKVLEGGSSALKGLVKGNSSVRRVYGTSEGRDLVEQDQM